MAKIWFQSLKSGQYTDAGFRDDEASKALGSRRTSSASLEPIADQLPSNIVLEVVGTRPPADFFQTAYMHASERLVEILKSYKTDAEYKEIEVRWGKGRTNSSRYWIVHVVGERNCIDFEHSKLTLKDPPGPTPIARHVSELVLLPGSTGDVHLFRVGECYGPLIHCVSDELADRIQSSGITGCCFLDPINYSKKYEFCDDPPKRSANQKASQLKSAMSRMVRPTTGAQSATGPMKVTASEIAELEQKLKLKLPVVYVSFLQNYPRSLDEVRLMYQGKPSSFGEVGLVFDSAEPILRENFNVRLDDGTIWTDDDGPWPMQYLCIGKDGGGNYRTIDLESTAGEVFFYDHETGSFELKHASLEEFAGSMVKYAADFNRSVSNDLNGN